MQMDRQAIAASTRIDVRARPLYTSYFLRACEGVRTIDIARKQWRLHATQSLGGLLERRIVFRETEAHDARRGGVLIER